MELAQDGKAKSVTAYKVLEDQRQKSSALQGGNSNLSCSHSLQILIKHGWWHKGNFSGGVNWESLPRASQHGVLGSAHVGSGVGSALPSSTGASTLQL